MASTFGSFRASHLIGGTPADSSAAVGADPYFYRDRQRAIDLVQDLAGQLAGPMPRSIQKVKARDLDRAIRRCAELGLTADQILQAQSRGRNLIGSADATLAARQALPPLTNRGGTSTNLSGEEK